MPLSQRASLWCALLAMGAFAALVLPFSAAAPDTTMIDIMRDTPDEDIEAMAHSLAYFVD